jgi:hypothetical protein
VTPLNPDRSRVSVVPGLSREDMDRAKKSSEQARLDRLESEVKSLREEASSRMPPPAPSTERDTVFVPYYDGASRLRPVPPKPPLPPKPPRPQPVETPPPPLYTRPK